MTAFAIQVGSVSDRSFNTGGLSKTFADWAVAIPSAHGAGWYAYDDQRGASSDPYVVFCNQASPTVNSKAMYVRWKMMSGSEQIRMAFFLDWDNVAHAGFANFDELLLTTQTGTFSYYFRGGPEIIMAICRRGTVQSMASVQKWAGIWNATLQKGTEPESVASTLATKGYLATDPGGYLNNYHLMTGFAGLLDGSGNLYFSIVSDGGGNFHIDIFSDSGRTTKIGHTASFAAATTGNKAITADASSGLGGTIGTAITVAAATNISCRFNRLTVQTGDGSKFTAGRRYFITDFTGHVQRIRYVKVTAISGDILTIDSAGAFDWSVGANISAHHHRWVSYGFGESGAGNSQVAVNPFNFPYVSVQGSELTNLASGNNQLAFDWMQTAISHLNPDDDGDYGAQFPWVVENGSSGANGYNRFWGKLIYMIITAPAGLAVLQDRRVLSGVPYIAISVGANSANCILDQESLS